MRRIAIFFGLPGSGKSSLSVALHREYGYHYVHPGAVLRAVANGHGDPVGRLVAESLRTGKCIPDELFNRLILASFEQRPIDKIVFDGYPRTRSTAKYFQQAVERAGFTVAEIYPVVLDIEPADAFVRYKLRNRDGDNTDERFLARKRFWEEFEIPVLEEVSKRFGLLRLSAYETVDCFASVETGRTLRLG